MGTLAAESRRPLVVSSHQQHDELQGHRHHCGRVEGVFQTRTGNLELKALSHRMEKDKTCRERKKTEETTLTKDLLTT